MGNYKLKDVYQEVMFIRIQIKYMFLFRTVYRLLLCFRHQSMLSLFYVQRNNGGRTNVIFIKR